VKAFPLGTSLERERVRRAPSAPTLSLAVMETETWAKRLKSEGFHPFGRALVSIAGRNGKSLFCNDLYFRSSLVPTVSGFGGNGMGTAENCRFGADARCVLNWGNYAKPARS
jgi:hypothetical protein